MPSWNTVHVEGRLGRDPEVKYIGSGGKAVTEVSIAVNAGKDKPPIWVPVKAWNERAGVLAGFKKGQMVVIDGQIGVDTWQDKNSGAKREKLYVLAWDIALHEWSREDAPPATAPPPLRATVPTAADLDDHPF